MTEKTAARGRVGRFRMRRRCRVIAASLLTLVVLFCGVTVRLFVLPATGMPTRVNAIVVLGGQGNRLGLGLQLAQQGHAPYLLVSDGLPFTLPTGLCEPDHGSFTVICWNPEPGTTKGEAEFVGRMARQHHWVSIVLVTTPDQAWRAALYVRRCYTGKVYSMTTPLNSTRWPYMIAYQWGATMKAETLQRGGC
jgi:uncharacterized SAM-binding protein YcdF (DUF218 family)